MTSSNATTLQSSKIFVTSDTHFFHKNVIGLCNRPFSSVEEMNEQMVMRWNDVVSSDDHVYHLGDFSFGKPQETLEIVRRLNGVKHLVLGNHDHVMEKGGIPAEFEWIKSMYDLKVGRDIRVVMCHYPILSWNRMNYGAFHIHGHRHCLGENKGRRYDVGVDGHDFYPLNLTILLDKLMDEPYLNKYELC